MATLHMAAGSNQVLAIDSMDTVYFDGADNGLVFSRSEGTTIITTGTNQALDVYELPQNDAIYDMGQGLKLQFAKLTEFAVANENLQVSDFQNDTTGVVDIQSEAAYGETATVTSDGQNGSWLSIGGFYPGMVHFVGDPVANLDAHLNVAPLQPPPPPDPPPPAPDPPPATAPDPPPAPIPVPPSPPNQFFTGNGQTVNITPASLGLTGPHFVSGPGTGTLFTADAYGDPSYNTVVNMHPGDAAKLWGITSADLANVPSALGSNLYAIAPNQPMVELAGVNMAQASISFGSAGGQAFAFIQDH